MGTMGKVIPLRSPEPKGASPKGRESDWDASLF